MERPMSDIREFYTNRSQENIPGVLDLFEDWTEDQLSAIMLDVAMTLATQRRELGQKALLQVLTTMDELIKESQQYRRTMN